MSTRASERATERATEREKSERASEEQATEILKKKLNDKTTSGHLEHKNNENVDDTESINLTKIAKQNNTKNHQKPLEICVFLKYDKFRDIKNLNISLEALKKSKRRFLPRQRDRRRTINFVKILSATAVLLKSSKKGDSRKWTSILAVDK